MRRKSFEKGLEDKSDFDQEMSESIMKRMKKLKNQQPSTPLISIKREPLKNRIPKINIAIGKRPIFIRGGKKRRRKRKRRKRPMIVYPEPEPVIKLQFFNHQLNNFSVKVIINVKEQKGKKKKVQKVPNTNVPKKRK